MTESAPRRETPPQPTAAEREVANLLPIEADPDAARAVLDRVPLWFHTFSLDHSDGGSTRPASPATIATGSPPLRRPSAA